MMGRCCEDEYDVMHDCVVHDCVVHDCVVRDCVAHDCVEHDCVVHDCVGTSTNEDVSRGVWSICVTWVWSI